MTQPGLLFKVHADISLCSCVRKYYIVRSLYACHALRTYWFCLTFYPDPFLHSIVSKFPSFFDFGDSIFGGVLCMSLHNVIHLFRSLSEVLFLFLWSTLRTVNLFDHRGEYFFFLLWSIHLPEFEVIVIAKRISKDNFNSGMLKTWLNYFVTFSKRKTSIATHSLR